MRISNKLDKCLNGKPDNHLLPFFWQHGEDDDVILAELHRIYESGVGAICVESRPHEGFARDPWWEDMILILDECEKLGLDVWILDDKYFPTGFCNGAVRERFPELGKRGVTERHLDVRGPVAGGAVILEGWAEEGDELLGVIACRRGDRGEELTGECIDLSDRVSDGLVYFDVPEGVWRVFFIFERPVKDGRVDFTNPESVRLMFDEIYVPHYEHLKKYFGKTFKGFFSDEPFLMDHGELPLRGKTKSKGVYPWNKYIKAELVKRFGDDYLLRLPGLWFTMNGFTPRLRVAYMDSVTTLYKTHFCDAVGRWCRNHGIEYIGHIVEDFDQHSNTGSGGHYFRSLDGQDMAGIDVVLCQIVPGMTEHANSCPCWYDIADPDLFHFSLAKLAASHAHIQPEKKGRALCEIFGAYGWAEGLKMMKWLADHMLVRGLNYFVPHAFSAKFPDEVPPQFSGAGHNAEYRYFRILTEYMNRVSTLLSDGEHVGNAAILYHAESEWTGGDYMKFYEPARRLTENNIDFDVISVDYLLKSHSENGKMILAGNTYDCFIVPYAEYITEATADKLKQLAEEGVDIVFIDRKTKKTVEGGAVSLDGDHVHTVGLNSLSGWMRKRGYCDVTANGNAKYLRFYHSRAEGEDVYMLTNEAIDGNAEAELEFSAFTGGAYVVYRPIENKAERAVSENGKIKVELRPYESVTFIFGADADRFESGKPFSEISASTLSGEWSFSMCTAEEYPEFRENIILDGLVNMSAPDKYPRFGGFFRYETTFKAEKEPGARYILDLGYVGETAEVEINGNNIGALIIPPYRFDITEQLRDGTNDLSLTVSNHLGYEQRDLCSKYLLMEPSGLIGPVRVITEKQNVQANHIATAWR